LNQPCGWPEDRFAVWPRGFCALSKGRESLSQDPDRCRFGGSHREAASNKPLLCRVLGPFSTPPAAGFALGPRHASGANLGPYTDHNAPPT